MVHQLSKKNQAASLKDKVSPSERILTSIMVTASFIKLQHVWSTNERVFRHAEIMACNSDLKISEKLKPR